MTRILSLILTITLLTSWLNSTPQLNLITFPSPEVEFIIGPQLKSGDLANPSPWFDSNAIANGVVFGERFPSSPPIRQLQGTVSLTGDAVIVNGTDTKFLTDFPAPVNRFNFFVRDAAGVLQTYYIKSVESDTTLTLSQPWRQPTQSGRLYFTATGDETNDFQNRNYYDQAMVQYINYYRTGDARFLGYARKIADSWWKMQFIDEGRAEIGNTIAPRTAALDGLMLRALDGRPEMWSWITAYTRYAYDLWIGQRLDYPSLYFGAREGGYMLLFAANLARVHPDPAVREEFRAKALNAAVNYFARLQKPDGSWRWGDPAWIGDAMQPFHVGILLEGMIAVHRLTGDVRVRDSIIKGTEALYLLGFNPNQWGAMYYEVWGSWEDGTDCTKGCGMAATVYPGKEFGDVAAARQLNANCLHAFGYSYLLIGDPKFKQWGDEILNASFNAEQGFRLLAWFNEKSYDEAYRSGGRYLAWRLGGAASTPSPTPTVSPIASPSPVITPSPVAAPTPMPTPSICTMTVNSPVVPQWGSGKLVVTFTGLTQPGTVRATATSGQVVVDSTPKSISGTSVIAEFWLQVKKKSTAVTVTGPCGAPQTVMVNVR